MKKASINEKPASTTPRAASRVQSAEARSSGGTVVKGGHAGRMQAAAARNHGKSGAKKGG